MFLREVEEGGEDLTHLELLQDASQIVKDYQFGN